MNQKQGKLNRRLDTYFFPHIKLFGLKTSMLLSAKKTANIIGSIKKIFSSEWKS